jgi:two-component system, NarL family, invasion response regulator UvrY
MSSKSPIKVAVAHSSKLTNVALSTIASRNGCKVMFEVTSGKTLLTKLKQEKSIEILIMDIPLKDLSAYVIIKEVKKINPKLKVLIVSNYDHPYTISYMAYHGINGFLSSDADETSVAKAIKDIQTKGYYSGKTLSRREMAEMAEIPVLQITKKQIAFLEYCCTDMNYYEMAEKMKVSHRTVDWYRDLMFERHNLTNRADLVLFSLKTGLVTL